MSASLGVVALALALAGWTDPGPAGVCRVAASDPEPPAYYALDLVATRRVVGTGRATGTAGVTFAPSPFGIALASDGSYLLDVWIDVERLPEPPADGAFVAWLTNTDLTDVRRVGPLDPEGRARGRVAWNKFLVVISYEAPPDPEADRWSGPVVLRGMSRSGMMHTMAGHGPFEQENCAAYGY